MPLTVQFEDDELPELRITLDRAMGCWEPKAMPAWVQQLSDRVDKKLGQYVEPYNARQHLDHTV